MAVTPSDPEPQIVPDATAAPMLRLHPLSWLFALLIQLRPLVVPLLVLIFLGRGEWWELFIVVGAVGYALHQEDYALLMPCSEPSETNCYVTWASFREGFPYPKRDTYYGNVSVNPITWRMDTLTATTQGGVLLHPKRKKRFTSTAHIQNDQLMVKTNMPLMRKRKILHVVDFNLFWMDVRENVALRVGEYLKGN